MPNTSQKKLKRLYLLKILFEQTDETHAVTLADLLRQLEQLGIPAERKSIYDDIETLRSFGFDIVKRKTKTFEYCLASRRFQMAELKLLVDAVQSARFLTGKKSGELIRKLEGLCSAHQAKELQREVVITDRVKTLNESVYDNVDLLQTAILQNRRVRFRYFDWELPPEGTAIQRVYKHKGKFYRVSPWALTWNQENYYLIAYDAAAKKLKHFRVDKIKVLGLLRTFREPIPELETFNVAEYVQKTFGMFGGEEEEVCLEFSEGLLGVVVDRFGAEVPVTRIGRNRFRVTVQASVSPLFLSWLFGFGTEVRVVAPKQVAELMREQAKAVAKLYKEK